MCAHTWRSRRRALYLAVGWAALPVPAQSLQPHQAQEVKPYRAKEVKPFTAPALQPKSGPRDQGALQQDPSFFFRTFGLAVPGGVYSWDNLAAQTRTTVVAAGALTKSSILINPDHTYTWNSAWDGRVIQGRWVLHKDGLLLQQGQERKDWILGRLERPSGAAIVYLSDRNATVYHGTPRPAGH